MVFSDFKEIVCLIFNDFYVRTSVLVVGLICTFIFLLSSFSGFLVLFSYILGYILSIILIKYPNNTSLYVEKILNNSTLKSTIKSVQNDSKSSCSVCDNFNCKRHEFGKNLNPWKDIKITKDLNEAIEHFYNRILNDFISSWYNQFTDNQEFINELRYCLKFSTATLINRFLQIDYINLIINKLIPQGIKHIDDYLYMQQISKLKNVKFNDVIVEYLGKNLHPATTSRNNELEYLRHLSGELIKLLLPPYYINCKNYLVLLRELLAGWVFLPLMDVIADPNILNYLILIIANYKSSRNQIVDLKDTEFLKDFINVNANKKSPFAVNLNKIKNSTELLYSFMQFLIKHEQVYFLQFCLDVDDFNTKLLTPELSKKELEELHINALNLYKEYLKKDSRNFIGCPEEISIEFSDLISDIYSVAKLRTSKPLYQAYDYAFNYLEIFWLPQFFHSNEFYNCICGSKVTATFNKTSIKSKKYNEPSTYSAVSKLGNSLGKIRGVLKASAPIEGSIEQIEADFSQIPLVSHNLIRDLSNWQIKIPKYQITSMHKITYFCISVQHTDLTQLKNWIVWRKDQDFFTLKAKLVEFHGENEICDSPLPSRKAGSLVESRISKYEDFLTKLLRKPALKGSDLLHTFLTSEEDFTIVISTLAPNNQDIGNIYQSVAYKLRKEKGQNLDSFINSFVASISKPQHEKVDIAEEGLELTNNPVEEFQTFPKTFKSKVFNDNFNISFKLPSGSSGTTFNPLKFSESLFYLFRHVFKLNNIILKIYVAICSVLQQIIDLLGRILIEKKLKTGLSQHNLAFLIGLLEGVIFNQHQHSTAEELNERKNKALNDIQCCPEYLNTILGGKINKGLIILWEILQNPHYNKQLSYNLLDTILVEIFPELNEL